MDELLAYFGWEVRSRCEGLPAMCIYSYINDNFETGLGERLRVNLSSPAEESLVDADVQAISLIKGLFDTPMMTKNIFKRS